MEDVAVASSGAGQLVMTEALRAARGNDRAALALLQACYIELSIRLAIEEQTHERQLPAVAAFCQVGGQMLIDQGRAYLDAASKDSEGLLLGRLHNAQEQRDRFELFLRRRFETEALTRTPSEASVDDVPDDEI